MLARAKQSRPKQPSLGSTGEILAGASCAMSRKPRPTESSSSFVLDITQLFPGEDRNAFEQFRQSVFVELAPKGVLQEQLASQIASLAWRQDNLDIFEKAELAGIQWAEFFKPGTNRGVGMLNATASVVKRQTKQMWGSKKSQPKGSRTDAAHRLAKQLNRLVAPLLEEMPPELRRKIELEAKTAPLSPEAIPQELNKIRAELLAKVPEETKVRIESNGASDTAEIDSIRLAAQSDRITRSEFLNSLDLIRCLNDEIEWRHKRLCHLQSISAAFAERNLVAFAARRIHRPRSTLRRKFRE